MRCWMRFRPMESRTSRCRSQLKKSGASWLAGFRPSFAGVYSPARFREASMAIGAGQRHVHAREGEQRVFAYAVLASIVLHAALLFANFPHRDAASKSNPAPGPILARLVTPRPLAAPAPVEAAPRPRAEEPAAIPAVAKPQPAPIPAAASKAAPKAPVVPATPAPTAPSSEDAKPAAEVFPACRAERADLGAALTGPGRESRRATRAVRRRRRRDARSVSDRDLFGGEALQEIPARRAGQQLGRQGRSFAW